MLGELAGAFAHRWKHKSASAALSRTWLAARHTPVLVMVRPLFVNAAYRRHMALFEDRPGPLFFLDKYLARGLTTHQRAAAALHHYRHEVEAHGSTYFDAVYQRGGLVLWKADTADGSFEIRLTPGVDVPDEGGLSVCALHDGARMCVMSYCTVPIGLLVQGIEPSSSEATMFIARKQMSADRGYQRAFNKAFDRTTPAHLCFAAVEGIATAHGMHRVLGVSALAHLSFAPASAVQFEHAYGDFWTSLAGKPAPPFAHAIGLPMQLTPLDTLEPKARKRAIARRAHIEAVRLSALETLRGHLR